jgi:hypothetical protein
MKCPSESWEGYEAGQNGVPTDDELLAKLDAYGHLTWCVGVGEEDNDWMACFDFLVVDCPERGLLIAYHVVVNSESGGFIDCPEQGVVEATKPPFDLPTYWRDLGVEMADGQVTEREIAEAEQCQASWAASLASAIREAR